MKPALIAFLLILLPIIVIVALGTALFIGFGAILARWLPLSLFQASCLVIGTTLAIAALIHVLSALIHAHACHFDEDFDDEDYDFDPNLHDSDTFSANPNFSNVERNDYCPCGSGRKFKNCCENKSVK